MSDNDWDPIYMTISSYRYIYNPQYDCRQIILPWLFLTCRPVSVFPEGKYFIWEKKKWCDLLDKEQRKFLNKYLTSVLWSLLIKSLEYHKIKKEVTSFELHHTFFFFSLTGEEAGWSHKTAAWMHSSLMKTRRVSPHTITKNVAPVSPEDMKCILLLRGRKKVVAGMEGVGGQRNGVSGLHCFFNSFQPPESLKAKQGWHHQEKLPPVKCYCHNLMCFSNEWLPHCVQLQDVSCPSETYW